MKRYFLISMLFLATAAFAGAQIQEPTSDVLGAHLNYGRGCVACHAPHSGAFGNGINKSGDTTTGNVILWGQDVGGLFGKTITSGSTNGTSGYVETLPTQAAMTGATPDITGMLMCLSCHDGNYATGAMMKNQVYETMPANYGTVAKPYTLLGADGTTAGNYLNDHPVGLTAVIGCGGSYNWDCTISATGKVQMTGPQSAEFVSDYGFFVSPKAYNNTPTVMCTSCHNQHVMNVVPVKNNPETVVGGVQTLPSGTATGLPTGNYATMFFINSPYNPTSATVGSNQTAQFCRQCHGSNANEFYGANLPTVF